MSMLDTVIDRPASNLCFMEEEEKEITVDIGPHEHTELHLLVRRLVTNQPYNREALKGTLRKIWSPRADVRICNLENERLLFSFKTKAELLRIKRGSPWTFDNLLLVLTEVDEASDPCVVVPLKYQEFWVRVRGPPVIALNHAIGKAIGNIVGLWIRRQQVAVTFKSGRR